MRSVFWILLVGCIAKVCDTACSSGLEALDDRCGMTSLYLSAHAGVLLQDQKLVQLVPSRDWSKAPRALNELEPPLHREPDARATKPPESDAESDAASDAESDAEGAKVAPGRERRYVVVVPKFSHARGEPSSAPAMHVGPTAMVPATEHWPMLGEVLGFLMYLCCAILGIGCVMLTCHHKPEEDIPEDGLDVPQKYTSESTGFDAQMDASPDRFSAQLSSSATEARPVNAPQQSVLSRAPTESPTSAALLQVPVSKAPSLAKQVMAQRKRSPSLGHAHVTRAQPSVLEPIAGFTPASDEPVMPVTGPLRR